MADNLKIEVHPLKSGGFVRIEYTQGVETIVTAKRFKFENEDKRVYKELTRALKAALADLSRLKKVRFNGDKDPKGCEPQNLATEA